MKPYTIAYILCKIFQRSNGIGSFWVQLCLSMREDQSILQDKRRLYVKDTSKKYKSILNLKKYNLMCKMISQVESKLAVWNLAYWSDIINLTVLWDLIWFYRSEQNSKILKDHNLDKEIKEKSVFTFYTIGFRFLKLSFRKTQK